MIVFNITLEEIPNKGVKINITTPSGNATQAEIDVGLQLKQLVGTCEFTGHKTFTIERWGSKPNLS